MILHSCAFAVEGIVGCAREVGRVARGEALLGLLAEAADGRCEGALGGAETEHVGCFVVV